MSGLKVKPSLVLENWDSKGILQLKEHNQTYEWKKETTKERKKRKMTKNEKHKKKKTKKVGKWEELESLERTENDDASKEDKS